MKRTVIVVLEFDPTEYEGAADTPQGAVDLTVEMLKRDADLPERLTVISETAVRFVSVRS